MKKPLLQGLLILTFLFPCHLYSQVANDLPIVTETSNDLNQVKASSAKSQSSDYFSKTTSAALLSEPPNVNASNLNGNESEVSISVNPTNRDNQVICGHAPNFATMNTFFTTDGGQTWTAVPLGNAQDGRTSNFRFDPTVAFAGDGNVYVSYGLDDADGNRYLLVARSTDGGQSYTRFTTVAVDNSLDKWIIGTGPDASTAGQFNVYLAYRITQSGNVVTRLASSYDQGATFPTDVLVSDAGSLNTFGMPAVGPNGEVYVVWDDQSNASTSSAIRMDVSLDNGNTFGTDRLVGTTNVTRGNTNRYDILAQPDRGILAVPSIAVDRSGGPNNGRIYVAYTIVGGGGFHDTDVVVRYSDNQGVNWSGEMLVNTDGGTNSQFLPWLDVDQVTGQVVVVWYDARNDVNNQQVEAFVGYSNDGGNSFTNVLVSDNPSDQSTNNPNRTTNNFLEYIGIASLNGVAFPVWADNSLDFSDLDFFTDQIPIGEPPVADAGPDQTVECEGFSGTEVTLDGSASSDPNGDDLTYTWYEGATIIAGPTASPAVQVTLALGVHNITLEVDDGNLLTDTDEVTVTVEDTTPPVITLNGDSEITLECGVDDYTEEGAAASDICDPGVSVVISGTVDTHTPGTYMVTYNATDASGNNATPVDRTVIVEDTRPPVITIFSGQTTLWPPDHDYYTLQLSDLDILVEDECDMDVSADDVVIVSVWSDEAEDAKGGGDGFTRNDIVIGSSCQSVDLRKERLGSGNGRVYTLTLKVADASGNVGIANYEVHVPNNKDSSPLAVIDAVQYTVTAAGCEPATSSAVYARTSTGTDQGMARPSPAGYVLDANYPNPMNGHTRFSFTIPADEVVSLRIFNLHGQEVAVLVDGFQEAGHHELTYNASALNSGIYLYRLESRSFRETRQMIVIR